MAADAEDGGHKSAHSMILFQVIPEDSKPLSVEDRLSAMEENMKSLEVSIRQRENEFGERLQRLEGMLVQLVAALVDKQ